MKRKRIYLSIVALILILQFIPVNRDNPIVEADLIASQNIKTIFKKSCYDCHSNETKYPIYSYLFPVSFFLQHHIEEAREELNFSNWENLSASKKASKASDILEEIQNKEMPLFSYTILHRNAILTNEEIQEIRQWVEEMENQNESSN
ncbi:MAG: heme-binding domain-containing protein [Leptospiraceae bacterium]|nr:heme-binding domain-containing protein [Leptospiraceae bacterium]